MRLYITFSGSAYDAITQRIVEDGPKFGADSVVCYDDYWLERQEFRDLNCWLWDHHYKRGFGLYAWKPFILIDAMDRYMSDGDIVLYTDGDTYPIADLTVLYDECARTGGIMLFDASNWHKLTCKRDCFVVMGQDEPKYHDARAGVARFMLFQKGTWRVKQFLMEWLTYCVNPLATTFDPSVLKSELDGFWEHRTEQAIMTNLAHKYDCHLYREADQDGDVGDWKDHDRDLYPQPLFHQVQLPMTIRNKTMDVGRGSRYRNVYDQGVLV